VEVAVITYDQRLAQDPRWALSEGSRFFEGAGELQETLQRITKRLEEIGVPYAIAGGMALFHHGVRRFTQDVDLLVSAQGLQSIHDKLEGLGYVPPFKGSKNLVDATSGLRIEFLVTGQYPGDGKPKPVAFPDPANASVEIAGIRVLGLPHLVELKIASGMTGGLTRMKDFADVVALIQTLKLPKDFTAKLNPYVQGKYDELWDGIQNSPKANEIL
jgi:hypothetical protein